MMLALLLAAQLLPVDESARDPSFRRFKAGLQQIVAQRDFAALRAAVSADIALGPDWDRGVESFARMWKIEDGEDHAMWVKLATILRLGATREGRGFCAPYTVTRFPAEARSATAATVVGRQIPVRSAPDGPVIARLTHQIVHVEQRGRLAWLPVTWEGGSGYVPAGVVFFAQDWSICFAAEAGRWTITRLAPGGWD
jgi:hypothetical protein